MRNALILAGGQSSRMGRDKATLVVPEGTLLERVARAVEPLVARVIVVGGASADVPDELPGEGPLAAMCSGLRASDAEWTYVLACDLDEPSEALLRHLSDLAEDTVDAVAPRGEPLYALYRTEAALSAGLRLLDHGQRAARRLLQVLRTRVVEPEDAARLGVQSLGSINTPADYQRRAGVPGFRCWAS
ncbi:MAG: molybdenum cofactor guanylyltransferase [Armatimonadetes bacterium]|nr:molybdenum cofactor guanylyltransferase [Armatimonadota bacterium]